MLQPIMRWRGTCDYLGTWREMQDFTAARTADTIDEIWLLEHPPVYTLGLNGKAEHLLQATDIPVVQCDRGGQITYHGPGQLVIYFLLDIKRMGLGVKELVFRLEQGIIDCLDNLGIDAARKPGAPGVYVAGAKIAALGLRVRRGRCYHGLSLNVNMDLAPFANIDPCGYPDLPVTQLNMLCNVDTVQEAGTRLLESLQTRLTMPA